MATATAAPLSIYEAPRSAAESMVRALRAGNTLFDALFYDVGVFAARMLARGWLVDADSQPAWLAPAGTGPGEISLSAATDPEGTILIIDAQRSPCILHRFDDVKALIAHANSAEIRTMSITGVGSSALGSAAFAWNLSAALGEPVAAIVPGYGVADVVAQSMGGWMFGYQTWLKQATQTALAEHAPDLARVGRRLMMTAPGRDPNAAPIFQRGSGSADILHAILEHVPGCQRLYGHSKGALVIENAVRDLPAARAKNLDIVTFGCAIAKSTPARYQQVLGCFDLLGLVNSWGNMPTMLVPTQHTTNTMLPLSIPVTWLTCLLEQMQPAHPQPPAGPEPDRRRAITSAVPAGTVPAVPATVT
jgi:hypothetical protein